jgi:hypothetical protein
MCVVCAGGSAPHRRVHCLHRITSAVHSYLGGSAPPRRAHRVHCLHRITSAVHSYLRSISTAGAGAGAGGAGATTTTAGLAVLFFWIQNRMFERFTPKYSISFFYSGFAHFHDVCFYLTIYRVILSLGGGNSVT